jgi:hypothetical protein
MRTGWQTSEQSTLIRTVPLNRTCPEIEARWKVVRERILAVSHLLWTQGNICQKFDRAGRVWRLRYYERLAEGRLVQRTIRIGRDPLLAKRARELLKRCRARQSWLQEIPKLAPLVTRAAALGRRGACR